MTRYSRLLDAPKAVAGVLYLAASLCIWAESVPLDTRGPVRNTGMTVSVDEEGVQAPGYLWTKPLAREAWNAKWIGSSVPSVPGSATNLLRREINLEQTPRKVTAWLSSTNYLLYLNGQAAARGPADAGRDFQGGSTKRTMVDVRDLTSLFHQGNNALAVELLNCNNFYFEAEVEYPDGKKARILSDDSWKGTYCPYLKTFSIPTEDQSFAGKGDRVGFDAAAEPLGWQLPGFDDSRWLPARTGGFPPDSMTISELPPLMEAMFPYYEITRVNGAVKVPEMALQQGRPIVISGDGEFGVHFKRIMAGRCGVKVNGGEGARLYVMSNQTDQPGGKRIYPIRLRGGVQYFESRDYYALGTVNIVARHVTSPIEIMEVSADALSQPVSYQGSFSCSDDQLNALWKSGRWSTQICMITHHLDSPDHQEPISDYGDYLIADLVNYYSMGDNPWLARQDLRKWAWVMENLNYKTFHTSYIFYWLQSLLNYYDYTGDKSVIEELAPQVHGVIETFSSYLGKNGIISEAPNYMFMDWVEVWDDKNPKIRFACHHPPAVIGQGYMSALFYRALADAQRVCQLTHDESRFNQYGELRQKVLQAYRLELWNESKGLYRDGKPFVSTVKSNKWMPEDVEMESFSVQNNSIAVLHDLAPLDKQASIVEGMMKTSPWNVTPYYMHFVLDGIAHAGLFEKYGFPQLHTWVIVPQTQTVQEMGTGRGDYSHGWIATPTYQMSSKILGVMPTAPGFAMFSIRPTLCGLAFAKGQVPTPHGLIGVDWSNSAGAFHIKVVVPLGTKALLALPVGNNREPKITSGGKLIWDGQKPGQSLSGISTAKANGTVVELTLEPGTYEFEGPQVVAAAL